MQVTPYLHFNGRSDEAIEFYKQALGAEVAMMARFKDAPVPAMCPAGMENKVMHAHLKIGSADLLVSDGRCTGEQKFDGFSLSITTATEAEAQKTFAALSQGGQVLMPMAKTFFSPAFGMTADKFGVMWMVLVRTA